MGIAGGVGTGILIASTMSFLDWRANPGGIFHDASGTHWNIVWETAVSWLLPVAATTTMLMWLIFYLLSRPVLRVAELASADR